MLFHFKTTVVQTANSLHAKKRGLREKVVFFQQNPSLSICHLEEKPQKKLANNEFYKYRNTNDRNGRMLVLDEVRPAVTHREESIISE